MTDLNFTPEWDPEILRRNLHAAHLELHRLRELVKQADLQHIRLRAGLREAIDLLSDLTGRTDAYDDTLADLRKLLGGEP